MLGGSGSAQRSVYTARNRIVSQSKVLADRIQLRRHLAARSTFQLMGTRRKERISIRWISEYSELVYTCYKHIVGRVGMHGMHGVSQT